MQTSTAVKTHMIRTLSMFEKSIDAIAPEHWKRHNNSRPAGIALHLLETIEFYASGQAAGAFKFGYRFDVDWEGADDGQLPEKEQIKTYLAEVAEKVTVWLDTADLAGPEKVYPWTGRTVLDRAMYVLRHTQHHVGQLSKTLQDTGGTVPGWQ